MQTNLSPPGQDVYETDNNETPGVSVGEFRTQKPNIELVRVNNIS